MAQVSSNEDDGIVGINVTPLVDVTLVLLVIFMVTAKLIVSQAIPMQLPPVSTPGAVQTVLTVSVDPAGTISANGKQVDDAALRAIAKTELGKDKELRTVIAASKSATHGAVLHAIDELRAVGVTKIAFAGEKKP
ncbi:MAG: ExbD/TolR family protein [Polyangiales bacterium]